MITLQQLMKIMPAARPSVAASFVDPLNRAMFAYEITTQLREAAFLAQVAHESTQLSALVESFNYKADRLLAVFPHYFDQKEAEAYARQPARIASRVYANRMGNGDEASGDGWKYRGRGLIQITGRKNYQACGEALGLDLLDAPIQLEAPPLAAMSTAWFWKENGLNELADHEQFTAITRKINGGTNGLPQRLAFYKSAMKTMEA